MRILNFKALTFIIVFSGLFLLAVPANAQHYFDSLYIHKFYNKAVWAIYQNYNNHSLYLSQSYKKDSLINTSLNPEAESFINIGVSYSNEKYYFAFNLLNLLNQEPKRKPPPKAINFVIGISQDNQLSEFGVNWFSGYFENNSKNFMPNFNDSTAFYQYKGMSTLNIFLNSITFTNKRKFSYSAAYRGTELQKKSAASFLYYFTVNYNRMKSDSSIIPFYVRNSYNIYGNLNRISNTYFSSGVGVSGTWVITKAFFTNLTLMTGPGFQYQNYSFVSDNKSKNRVNLLLHSDIRYSIGLNLKRFYILSTTMILLDYYNMNKLSIASGHLMNYLTFGYRFNRRGRIY